MLYEPPPLCHPSCVDLSMFTMCVSGVYGRQKRTLDPLELVSQTIVSHHVGSGNALQE